ncbi:MAG: hypothetical protein AAF529_01050 [Pseudomonadota bacterium]
MRIALLIVLLALLVGAAVYVRSCPCEQMPGLWLTGDTATTPVADWSFANDVGLCQVQVESWRPHSINLNCMSAQGRLFVSCSRCEGKYWSGVALDNPKAYLRADGTVYPVLLRRLQDDANLDLAWRTRASKLGLDDVQRPQHWWSFEATSL